MQLTVFTLIICCVTYKTRAAEIVDVYQIFTKDVNECSQYGLCGALGRHPCPSAVPQSRLEEYMSQCGPCINGFTEMKGGSGGGADADADADADVSRICRRMKPTDRVGGDVHHPAQDSIVQFTLEKRATYLNNGASSMFLSAAQDNAVKAAANRHTMTFLILIAMAVAGVILVGILGLSYHNYAKGELKNNSNSIVANGTVRRGGGNKGKRSSTHSSSNRKLSYGFEGADDNEDKELARKTQIYHYQHQKRMISSMENRKCDVDCENGCGGGADENCGKVVEEASLLLEKQPGPGTGPLPPQVVEGPSRDSLLRMRSQGSVGSPKETRSVKAVNGGHGKGAMGMMGQQHQSIDRLSSSAQRQQQQFNTSPAGTGAGAGSGGMHVDDSEEEVDPDFTVYECPGLAPSGEMEVKNPLFSNEEDNMTTDEE